MERDLDCTADHHGKSGPIPVRRWPRADWLPPQVAFRTACLAAGFPECPDHNAPGVSGVGAIPLNTLDGVRWSTQVAYLNPARARPNLAILPNCTARRVIVDHQRAVGVVVDREGQQIALEGDEIVLSAGAVGSPHLLLLSGIGPADQLRQLGIQPVVDSPGVGQNLRDHPHVYATWQPKPEVRMEAGLPRYQVALRYTAPGSGLRNDLQILMVSFATGRVDRGGDGLTPLGITLQPVLNLADSQGFGFLNQAFDRQRLRDALRLCVDLASHAAFEPILDRRVTPTDAVLGSDEALDQWMAREVTTTNHISGTCKMGPASDPLAVVSQTGQVHGIAGLRVVDASIMPDCVRANTNATAMLIGERIAALLG